MYFCSCYQSFFVTSKVTKEAGILQEGFCLIFCRVKLLPDSNNSDYKKVNGKRNSDNGIGDGNMLVHRMYGAVEIEGMTYTE